VVNKIAVIAILGLTSAAVCMGAAAAISGGQFEDILVDPFGGEHCDTIAGATATSRTLDWDGSDHAGLAIPGTANYAPGNDDKVHAAGDAQVLAHLRIRDGKIEMDCRGWHSRVKNVTITLPGREFRKFQLAGTGTLNLNGLNQTELAVDMAGLGTITAHGKVDDLSIRMAGVSTADFGQVTGRKAKVKMAGVNKAHIAPTEEADIDIAGPSEVTLHSNPPKLDTRIAGPGRIHKVAPGA
jgi:hypothetical protein